MTIESIFGFVLALTVVGAVAVLWTISTLRAEVRDLASWRSASESKLLTYGGKWNGELTKMRAELLELREQSPVELGARVVELSEAVERLRKTHQRFAGRVSQELGADGERPPQAPTAASSDRDALRRAHAADILPAGIRK